MVGVSNRSYKIEEFLKLLTQTCSKERIDENSISMVFFPLPVIYYLKCNRKRINSLVVFSLRGKGMYKVGWTENTINKN